jgi:hypothetical protein
LIDLSLSQILDIFKLLTLTIPRYTDSASRDAVEAVGMELVRNDEIRGTEPGSTDEFKLGVTEQILGWLSNEVGTLSKRSNAEYVSVKYRIVIENELALALMRRPISSSY